VEKASKAVVDCLESTNRVGLPGPVLIQRVVEEMQRAGRGESDDVAQLINYVITTGLREKEFVLAGAYVRLASWGDQQ
jgi:hypothetical protein